jgi:Zn-dependent protease
MNPFAEHLIVFLMFVPIITIHEAAHAWAAHLLGDDTAKDEGRLTLDPLAHIDAFGTILVPAINVLFAQFLGLGAALIGWGRPVPVDGRNLRGGRRGEVAVALAGPAANFLLAFAAVALTGLLAPGSSWNELLNLFAFVSAFLGFFNLLPLPPFDGWTLVRTAFRLPETAGMRWGLVFFLLFFFLFSPVNAFLTVVSQDVVGLMHLAIPGHL